MTQFTEQELRDMALPDGVQYSEPYIPVIRTCEFHKIRHRVDCVNGGPGCAVDLHQHCPNDVAEYLPGPILAVYEEHNGKWVAVPIGGVSAE